MPLPDVRGRRILVRKPHFTSSGRQQNSAVEHAPSHDLGNALLLRPGPPVLAALPLSCPVLSITKEIAKDLQGRELHEGPEVEPGAGPGRTSRVGAVRSSA